MSEDLGVFYETDHPDVIAQRDLNSDNAMRYDKETFDDSVLFRPIQNDPTDLEIVEERRDSSPAAARTAAPSVTTFDAELPPSLPAMEWEAMPDSDDTEARMNQLLKQLKQFKERKESAQPRTRSATSSTLTLCFL